MEQAGLVLEEEEEASKNRSKLPFG